MNRTAGFRGLRAIGIGLFGAIGACAAWAQCPPGWLPGTGLPGISGHATCAAVWDPDGDGPLRPLLVVGGAIAFAGETPSFRIAAWDGERWSPLGGGLNDVVYTLGTFRGDLVAGGVFTSAAGVPVARVAAWDGVSWSALGAGVDGRVDRLIEYRGELFVCGAFNNAGGVQATHFAAWNGSEWRAPAAFCGSCNAMVVHDDRLIVGGNMCDVGGLGPTRIAMWDGSAWSKPAQDFPVVVRALATHEGDLVAVGGSGATVTVRRLGDGGWETLGAGTGAPTSAVEWRGELFVGGVTSLNDMPLDNVGRWTGAQWLGVGVPIDRLGSVGANALTVYEDELVIAGGFWGAGGSPAMNVALWNGTDARATAVGFDQPVRALLNFNGALVAGGSFYSAPGVRAPGIAAWDGAKWSSIEGGFPMPSTEWFFGGVWALGSWQGDLLAGGFLSVNGADQENIVAQWNGDSWQALTPEFSGGAAYSAVRAIAEVGGTLYVGGTFAQAGSTTVNGIARRSGSTWAGLGGSAKGVMNGAAIGAVYAIAEYQGAAVVGGQFTNAGNVAAANVARWNGAAWESLGSGLSGTVYAMAVYRGDLFAGGVLSTAGESPAPNIAAWDGTQWRNVGAIAGPVNALAVMDDRLIAGGSFEFADGNPAKFVAEWDGQSWRQFDAGLDGAVTCLGAYGDELAAGGSFTSAGRQRSMHLARWSPAPEAPAVGVHPAPASTCPGGTASFSVQATGTAPFEFRWRRGGVPLRDGMHGAGRVLGAGTATLTISGVALADAGLYDCEVENTCGSAASDAAELILCVADVDCNSFVNGDDFDVFVVAFEAGDPSADINADGFTNGDDFDLFAAAFDAGC